jgi:hypothetical protein
LKFLNDCYILFSATQFLEVSMAYGDDSERIRKRAWEKYISPQIQRGVRQVVLPIKPLMKELESEGFPPNHPRQFCKALQKKSFLVEKGLVLRQIEGPPSGTSTTVILHFDIQGNPAPPKCPTSDVAETPSQRAFRLTERVRGLLKEEIAAFGGTDAFMRWVRSDDEDAA